MGGIRLTGGLVEGWGGIRLTGGVWGGEWVV